MTVPLPPYAPLPLVQDRLRRIFPEGFEFYNWATREIAAKTVFAMLYVGAVEGLRLFGPKQVYRMSDKQARRTRDEQRIEYAVESLRQKYTPIGKAWYADTTREPIRDETLRQTFVPVKAAIVDKSVPTTSSLPRYALASDFAALFDPSLTGAAFDDAIVAWQKAHLSKGALAHMKLVTAGATKSLHGVMVTFPNGETRRLSTGDSSIVTKQVIEEFAPKFLTDPAVLWISESGNKVVQKDDLLAGSIGLKIDAAKNLPDVILVDLVGNDVLVVFVEVVVSDGPISVVRRKELLQYATDGGFDESRVAFVSAYMGRDAVLKKTLPTLAWNSFVWVASEPDNIIALVGRAGFKLRELLRKP